jgi:hypothetical protein
MYITNLNAQDNTNKIYIKNPTWNQIRDTILALDGWDLNTILLEKNYEEKEQENEIKEFMSIAGGGKNKLYLCNVFSYEGKHDEIVLYEPSKSWDETFEIMHIFPGNYPAIRCLNLDSILQAAKTYSCFGKRDKSLHWGYLSLEKYSNTSPQFKIIEVKQ